VPEYDALVVGYDPKSRDRFLDPAHLPRIWMSANGSFSSAVLAGGRLAAAWRMTRDRATRIEVQMFPGLPKLRESDLADQVAALEHALDVEIADVRLTSAA
jgi:hypothetical protein